MMYSRLGLTVYFLFLFVNRLISMQYQHYDAEMVEENPKGYYFAYGTNMLRSRMSANVRNVSSLGPAVLANHRLDFDMWVDAWNGAVATICEDPGKEVWGVIWSIKKRNAKNLDYLSDTKLYYRRNVIVHTMDKKEHLVSTHVARQTPKKLPPWMSLPMKRRPSATYLKVLLLGATEAGLPKDYIENLHHIQHNGKSAAEMTRKSLSLPVNESGIKYNFGLNFEFKN